MKTVNLKINLYAEIDFNNLPEPMAEKCKEMILKMQQAKPKPGDIKYRIDVEEVNGDRSKK